MPRHSLFPNFIRIKYTSNSHQHTQNLPIAAVTPSGGSWNVTLRDDSAIEWTAAVDNWVDAINNLFNTASTIDSAELYDLEATDAPPSFLAAYTIGVNGTNLTATNPFSQLVSPFKGLGGTQLRLYFMEQVFPDDTRMPYATGSDAAWKDMADFVLSDDDFIITRGGGYPLISLGMVTKENDQLRKRYFLG